MSWNATISSEKEEMRRYWVKNVNGLHEHVGKVVSLRTTEISKTTIAETISSEITVKNKKWLVGSICGTSKIRI